MSGLLRRIAFAIGCTTVLLAPNTATAQSCGSTRVALLIDPALLSSIRASLDQFESDLCSDGYNVIEHSDFFGNPPALRTYLQQLYAQSGAPLVGAILVGNLPYAYQYVHSTSFNPSFPSVDEEVISYQYYADLDGDFSRSQAYASPGGHAYSYDQHTGSVGWEIWIGVLPYYKGSFALTVDAVQRYFAKNHSYRAGQLTRPDAFLEINELYQAASAADETTLIGYMRSGVYAWTPYSNSPTARLYVDGPNTGLTQGYADLSNGVARLTVVDAHGFSGASGQLTISAVETQPVRTLFFWSSGCAIGELDIPDNFLTSILYSTTSEVLLAKGTTNNSGGMGTNTNGFYGHNIATASANHASFGNAIVSHVNTPLIYPWSIDREFYFGTPVILGDPTLKLDGSQSGSVITAAPVLRIAKTHVGNFAKGQNGATYTVTVSNAAGAGLTTGTVTVTETVPTGLTLVSMAGAGWTCPGTAANNCTRNDALAAGQNYPGVTVTVNVAANAASQVTNQVSVSGGGSATATFGDVTTIYALVPSLALGKTATQSSTLVNAGPARAIDGNPDGAFSDGSVTATSFDSNAWWQVDLGASATISSIVVWNRTDCCGDRLSDYWVFVSNTPFGASDTPATLQSRAGTWSSHQTSAPAPSTSISFSSAQGRYVRVQLSGTNYLSLAEVQVLGTVGSTPTYSISGQVVLSGTSTGLSGVTVALSGGTSASTTTDTSGNYSFSGLLSGGNYTVTPSITGYTFTPASQGFSNLSATQTQNFAAVVAPAGSNLALGKAATQSSTLVNAGPARAIDGNTDGAFSDGSVTATSYDSNAWWQVDLGASATISSVVVWNRTDCCGDRLGDYWVFISNTPFGASDTPATLQSRAGTWSSHETSAPSASTNVSAGVSGRYVRIQLSGTNYLSLAEVQVLGTVGTGPTYSISGQVVLSGTSTGLSGVTVALSGGTSASTTTDTSGNYSFSGLPSGGNYTVTPSSAGYTFSPASQGFSNLSATQTQNFAAAVAPVGSNLALGKAATQSSTLVNAGPARAIDGNTDGTFSDGSVTATSYDSNAWWQVDLGASATISSVVVWNRTDCCGDRLGDYWVFISNTPFGASDTPATLQSRAGTFSSHQTSAPSASTSVSAGVSGRYVRIQLSGTNYLSLAEVQVLGTMGSTPTYSISGQVVLSGTSTGLSGVTVALSGGTSASTTTDTSGNYSFSGLPSGGNYTVTPSSAGYTFTPASQGFSNLSATQTQNFVAVVAPAGSNLALGKAATQSSTLVNAGPARAIDGNTDGTFSNGSVTATGFDSNAWWQVDLGASATIDSVVVWNRTDCCGDRLGDYWVFISNTPFGASDTPATLQSRAGTFSSHQTSAPSASTSISAGVSGRYVRIQLSGTNYLSLAEVQVLGTAAASGSNVAQGKTATQSSTLANAGPARAIDGNTGGAFSDGSVTATSYDSNAWWQVDLGASATISSVVVWNRTDCCGDRLGDFWVFISNTPFGASDTPATLQSRAGTSSSHQTSAPAPGTNISFSSAQGRYVRIQLSGTNYLSLAEVQVMGTIL